MMTYALSAAYSRNTLVWRQVPIGGGLHTRGSSRLWIHDLNRDDAPKMPTGRARMPVDEGASRFSEFPVKDIVDSWLHLAMPRRAPVRLEGGGNRTPGWVMAT